MIKEMSNLRRSSYSMLISMKLFRRFCFILLRWASFIILSLGATQKIAYTVRLCVFVLFVRCCISFMFYLD